MLLWSKNTKYLTSLKKPPCAVTVENAKMSVLLGQNFLLKLSRWFHESGLDTRRSRRSMCSSWGSEHLSFPTQKPGGIQMREILINEITYCKLVAL